MLVDEIKKRVMLAMKEKRDHEKEILKVALGEIQTAGARAARELSDEESAAIVRKLVKSNDETLGATVDPAKKAVLAEENAILVTLLPKGLGAEEILAKLEPARDAIRAAGNDGQATGVAMKHLKSLGLSVQGNDVAAAVKTIRSAP
jgi:uncharacterized protein YqeY